MNKYDIPLSLVHKGLHLLPSELAHNLAIQLLKISPVKLHPPNIPTRAAGIKVDNPVGLAPGFDRHGQAIKGLLNLGFGFIEIGGITPEPQYGNPKPRLFRLKKDRALINYIGSHSHGVTTVVKRLNYYRNHGGVGVVGVNLMINKTTKDPLKDYTLLAKKVSVYADFVTINVSSPNTKGLTLLQTETNISNIVDSVKKVLHPNTALWIKLSPDLDEVTYTELGKALSSIPIDGIVLTNTTVTRPLNLKSGDLTELGGLSGRPLKELSIKALTSLIKGTKGDVDIISVGGIENSDDAYERLKLGASLVQVNTAFIYEGYKLAYEMVKDLSLLKNKR